MGKRKGFPFTDIVDLTLSWFGCKKASEARKRWKSRGENFQDFTRKFDALRSRVNRRNWSLLFNESNLKKIEAIRKVSQGEKLGHATGWKWNWKAKKISILTETREASWARLECQIETQSTSRIQIYSNIWAARRPFLIINWFSPLSRASIARIRIGRIFQFFFSLNK